MSAAMKTEVRPEAADDGDQSAPYSEPGPPGLRALCAACARLYPEQTNPLQVTARVKYWLGGPDPLDYVSMYWNSGRSDPHAPPHWHYISMGVSDLHGDGRVHPPPDRVLLASADPPPSGYGFEMTFRLAAPPPPAPPPLWPAALLQSLARYIFTTGVRLCPGDHISWHAPLDGERSRLRHLLVSEDPQLPELRAPLGTVQFVQLVGATARELSAAQRGGATAVLRALAAAESTGGAWLVTDAARGSCALPAREDEPADLAGVSTALRWTEWTPTRDISEEAEEGEEGEREGRGTTSEPALSADVRDEIETVLQRGLSNMTCSRMSTDSAPRSAATQLSTDSLKRIFTGGGDAGSKCMSVEEGARALEMREVSRALAAAGAAGAGEAARARRLAGAHVLLNEEGGRLLPLALRGRVLQGRHFTWRCAASGRAVTLVAAGVSGALVSPERPCVATDHGWLQILIPAWLARDMLARSSCLDDSDAGEEDEDGGGVEGAGRGLPLVLEYPRAGLKLTVLHPDTPLY